MQNIGILGGTFDPIHWGHLYLAAAAMSQGNLDHLIWVPMRQPPHKSNPLITPFHHRLAMVQCAIAAYSHYTLSTVEAHRLGPSFAIHTLEDLQQHYPDCHWSWVIGLDAFRSLPRWYRRQDLAAQCRWLVAPRPPELPQASAEAECQQISQRFADQSISLQWLVLQLLVRTETHLSSSQVRQAYCDRQPIQSEVPAAVHEYILTHQLYQSD